LQRTHQSVSAQWSAPRLRAQQRAKNQSKQNVAAALEASEKNGKVENVGARKKML
jgi:hypothetical protein